ncbi:MAG: hypothetical protein EA379_10160 [Phycisphaerales bacterium]|nr:MAG: hypothetical protein EA379_10160 [Phycisphaerales bacterium]
MIAPTDSLSPGLAEKPAIVIIGGGFSGAALAAHLAAGALSPVRIVLFEPSSRVGRGVAYNATGDHLLLNVPAGKLSVWPERPGDFADWCAASGRLASRDAFLPRAWFGAYVEAELATALRTASGLVEFERRHCRAHSVRFSPGGGALVRTEHGDDVHADRVVLALGHGPSTVPPVFRGLAAQQRIVRDPRDAARINALASTSRRVLIVGTGLTMIDTVASLARTGFKGDVLAVSRRGVPARSHGASDPAAHREWAGALHPARLTELIRAVRARCEEHPEDWRGVIDSLRPHTARLWRTLGPHDRRRFQKRVAPYWDAHRHRAPQVLAGTIAMLLERGKLGIGAAVIETARVKRHHVEVEMRAPRTKQSSRERFDVVILCTGPEPDPSKWGSPLVDSLLSQGVAVVDPLGLGFVTDGRGALRTASGVASERLFTIGPLRRPDSWESTAVPELSRQAQDLAQTLIEGMKPSSGRGRRAATSKEYSQ